MHTLHKTAEDIYLISSDQRIYIIRFLNCCSPPLLVDASDLFRSVVFIDSLLVEQAKWHPPTLAMGRVPLDLFLCLLHHLKARLGHVRDKPKKDILERLFRYEENSLLTLWLQLADKSAQKSCLIGTFGH